MIHTFWTRALAMAAFATGAACDDAEPIVPSDWETTLVEIRDCRQGVEHDLEFIRLVVDEDSAEPFDRCTSDPDACDQPFPEGALFVKPQYADPDCTELVRISAARREHEAAEPGREGWRWQELDADGRVVIDGEASCIGCHDHCDGFDTRCAMDP